MELITLTVYREWCSSYNQTTILKDDKGRVKAIFPNSLRQPKRGTKTIVVNCNTFALNWDNVPNVSRYVKVKDRVKQ